MIRLYKLLAFSAFLMGLFLVSCENEDVKFDDYGTVACYFPYQTPVRTIILGKYEVGLNDNDNNHQFEIGVTLGGMYENKENRSFTYEVDNSLLDGVMNVKALPENYYSIETPNPVTIPSGSFKGKILVKLTDDFFNDELSVTDSVNYVIPLKIKSVEKIDTVLMGKPAVDNPMYAYAEDWSIAPKNYVLFGIKFINKYDANYLRRGIDKVQENSTEVVYHNEYIERDEVMKLTTKSLNSIVLTSMIKRSGNETPGNLNIRLVFDNNDKCTVFNDDTNTQIGSGEMNADSQYGIWGGKPHDTIFLDYTFNEPVNNETHHVCDTLVYRNRAVVFQEFNVLTENR